MKKYLVLSLFLLATTASASSDCGTITGPEDLNNGADITTIPIEDCNDPFGVTFVPSNPYTLYINDTVVANNDTYTLDEEGETNLRITGQSHQSDYFSLLFKHTNDGYEYIDRSIPEPTHSDEIAYLNTYFQTESERTRYGKILSVYQSGGDTEPFFYNEAIGEDILDIDTGEYVSDRFFDFLNSFYDYHYNQPPPPLNPGTYTLVFKEYELILNQHSFLQKLAKVIIPKAEASCDYCTPPYIYTITFTILPYEPAPTGASSVLFLPGIQASRLYKEGILGTEDQLWTPQWNQDVRQLGMTEEGDSVENIYTKDILDEVFGVGTVYKQFSESLDKLVNDETIKDWESYAYDWRFSVDYIVKNGTKYQFEVKDLIAEIEKLSKDSNTKKVSIVAHSNGGLLAKALLVELKKQSKEHLVDRLILLASPQVGTPKAIGSLLHGFDQSAGGSIVIDSAVARSAIANMPGAYGLLPTSEYFDLVGKSFIKFGDGESLQLFRNAYGEDIDNINELNQFLIGTVDERPETVSIYDASKLNKFVYNSSVALHENILRTWKAPASIDVIELVGVGLQTVSGFEYREFQQRVCTGGTFTESCANKKYYKPVPIFSLYGDQTVMAQSAKAYQGTKETYFLDLYKQGEIIEYKHVNFTESPSVQKFIERILKNENVDDIQFIDTSAVVQATEYNLLSINSPATVKITNENDEITEIVFSGNDLMAKKEEIPGSSIYYVGSTTYIVLPTKGEYQIDMQGTGTGGVTLVIDNIEDNVLETKYRIWVPDTQNGMKMSSIINNGEMNLLQVDNTGDGVVDFTIDPVTGIFTMSNTDVVPNHKNPSGSLIKIQDKPSFGLVAGISTSSVSDVALESYYKQLYVLLQQLQLLLSKYEKNKNI